MKNKKYKSFFRKIVEILSKIIGTKKIMEIEAKLRFNKTLNIDNPVTLSDKICYLEFNDINKFTSLCSDKYLVREYVANKKLDYILVPIYGGVYLSPRDIQFDKLPDKFVLKATHGSRMNIIVKNKKEMNTEEIINTANDWLKKSYNREFMEPHYAEVSKRIICEKYLEDSTEIIDYKIHCFNGKPQFILVCSDRNNGLKLNVYNLKWEKLNVIQGKHKTNKIDHKPKLLNKMLHISEILSQDFKFVRVDLYQIDEKIYFGELTFTPDGGYVSYFNNEFDKDMGKLLKIKENTNI